MFGAKKLQRHEISDLVEAAPQVALPAPAVATAVRILDFLAKQAPRAGLTEISRSLGINKSTCFNILLTLAYSGMVVRLSGQAQYQLGPKLAEFGGAVRKQFQHRGLLRRQLEGLVAGTNLVCMIGQPLGDESTFVIIDHIAPQVLQSRSPAPPVGSVFPITGPAMGRALLSCLDEEDAIAIVRKLGALTKANDEKAWRQQLSGIKRAGYATSSEQYKHGVNAVAVPVKQAGEAHLVIAIIGFVRDLSARKFEQLGSRLVVEARKLERIPLGAEG